VISEPVHISFSSLLVERFFEIHRDGGSVVIDSLAVLFSLVPNIEV